MSAVCIINIQSINASNFCRKFIQCINSGCFFDRCHKITCWLFINDRNKDFAILFKNLLKARFNILLSIKLLLRAKSFMRVYLCH